MLELRYKNFRSFNSIENFLNSLEDGFLPEILVIDTTLPLYNGKKLIDILKERKINTTVLLTKGYVNPIDEIKEYEKRLENHFLQTINTNLLISKIDDLLNKLTIKYLKSAI